MQTRFKVLLVFGFIALCIGVYAFIEYREIKENIAYLEKGLKELSQKEYSLGLETCDKMTFRKGICYESALGIMIRENETITSELCERFPTETNSPFYLRGGEERAVQEWTKSKQRCFELSR